jgi:hypothetical protein
MVTNKFLDKIDLWLWLWAGTVIDESSYVV